MKIIQCSLARVLRWTKGGASPVSCIALMKGLAFVVQVVLCKHSFDYYERACGNTFGQSGQKLL